MKDRAKEKYCTMYTGVTCIDGGCPIALRDEYIERGYETIKSCNECPYYKGCEDCYFYGKEECIRKVIDHESI